MQKVAIGSGDLWLNLLDTFTMGPAIPIPPRGINSNEAPPRASDADWISE